MKEHPASNPSKKKKGESGEEKREHAAAIDVDSELPVPIKERQPK